jgi:hypothetical protein
MLYVSCRAVMLNTRLTLSLLLTGFRYNIFAVMDVRKKRQWTVSRQFPELVVGKGEGTIADCSILLPSRTEAQNRANARLISLCPEMLELLVSMDDAVDAHKSGKGIQDIYDCRKRIRKLLVKLAPTDHSDKS